MKVMVDLNVLLDVIQRRHPHYDDSAQVVDAIIRNVIEGILPSHGITTLAYILGQHLSPEKTTEALEWLLKHFSVEPATHLSFRNALALAFADFEDAVVHTLAESANCDFIITRNVDDFVEATLPVVTPTQFLEYLESLT